MTCAMPSRFKRRTGEPITTIRSRIVGDRCDVAEPLDRTAYIEPESVGATPTEALIGE